MQTPCKNFPFRKDSLKGWLGSTRMTEILEADSFVCHKTTKNDIPNTENKNRKQCAGFMIIKKEESAAVQLSKILKIDLELKGQELVFETKQECINHHKN